MSQRVVYKCDRCNNEGDIKVTTIAVGIRSTNYSYNYNNDFVLNSRKEMDLCNKCLVDVGLLIGQKNEPKPDTESKVTLEDLVRLIVNEELEANTSIQRG